ncbi:BrnA antitoxin family protein [Methylocystis sp. H62]|uniref:BrnA antitoxin family protein n=1 Tax=Methylocystis sp. H62 TaxID=2785789 RepID=UPI0018C2179C|nr:BrnA antitoxin family protein [Methylocystis sp. H62]MBG0795928.1 BrnA antitoxin family protein [Methylocystis sp. H62]
MSEKPTTAKYTLSEIKAARARGEDPTRRDAPEAESLGEDFWKDARVMMPRGKTSVHLRLDSDVVEWFKAHGKGHLTRMNAVLRAYVDAHKGRG